MLKNTAVSSGCCGLSAQSGRLRDRRRRLARKILVQLDNLGHFSPERRPLGECRSRKVVAMKNINSRKLPAAYERVEYFEENKYKLYPMIEKIKDIIKNDQIKIVDQKELRIASQNKFYSREIEKKGFSGGILHSPCLRTFRRRCPPLQRATPLVALPGPFAVHATRWLRLV